MKPSAKSIAYEYNIKKKVFFLQLPEPTEFWSKV